MNKEKIDRIKYWIIDVDGTMTDAGIYYDEKGNEMKKFCTKDAAGFFAAHQLGMKIVVLTGRECYAVTRRMHELGVEYIYQDVKNKKQWLQDFIKENALLKDEVAYIGDDLNDYSAMLWAGFRACPNDANEEIKKISDYISKYDGGHGAVRDCIEYVLRKRKEWKCAIMQVYNISKEDLEKCAEKYDITRENT